MKFTRIATNLMLPAMLMFLSAEATAFNPESLKLLKTDIPGWNTMRSSSPERVMDLYKADLEDAELNRQTSAEPFSFEPISPAPVLMRQI